MTSRIRATRGGTRAALIVGWCLAVVALGLVVFGLVLLRSRPDAAVVAVSTLFSAQFLSWGLAPLVAFGVDETVDPSRFALLPLRPATLQRGLLATALVGYLPVANLVLLLGAAVALSPRWWMLLLAVPCAVVQLILCVTFSRALSTAMSGLMSGRRGRDLGVMVGFAVFVLYMGLSWTLNRAGSSVGLQGGLTTVGRSLAWGPPGALAALPSRVADGRWAAAGIGLLTVLVALALLWWWWAAALRRSLTTVPSTTEGSAPAHASASGTVAADVTGTMWLMVQRDRVLAWRDPMRRAPWLIVAFLSIVWPLLVIRGAGAVFGVVLAAVLAGTQAGNQYGTEGSALWLHMVAFADRMRARGEALGHAVFALIPGVAIVVVACTVLSVIRSELHLLPAALGVCLGALTGSTAMAGYLSARVPFAARQSRTSMFAGSIPGQKARTAGAGFAIFGAGVAAAVVPGLLTVLALTTNPVWGWVALVVGPAVGVAAILLFTRAQARTYLARTPEILAVVAVGDRS
ncbi:hypothetical protein [Nakamurella endophytica]|uniref:hypothetical protein n=1 Tax=Nakamurella endophytica TaxID=1748367 RepID=UPI00166F1E65|nr:hypothetical protein [Nakamurella endophytica]